MHWLCVTWLVVCLQSCEITWQLHKLHIRELTRNAGTLKSNMKSLQIFLWCFASIISCISLCSCQEGPFNIEVCTNDNLYCWCVDEWGNLQEGSNTTTAVKLQCPDNRGTCQREADSMKDPLLMDAPVIDCQEGGVLFRARQSYYVNGMGEYCHCVDVQTGETVERTDMLCEGYIINCDEGATECQMQVADSFFEEGLALDPTPPVPTCDENGLFISKQCGGGMCWCSDPVTGHHVGEHVLEDDELNCDEITGGCRVVEIDHGYIIGDITNSVAKSGFTVRFTCAEGFTLVGSSEIACTRGEFSDPMPTCEIK